MYATYRDIPDLISKGVPFRGNSVVAVDEYIGGYHIYSYNTLIYREADNYFNDTYYSNTTSRIQNIIREVIYGKKKTKTE